MSYPYSNTPPPPVASRLAVVVVCHGPYLPYLPKCIETIEGQEFNAAKYLVLDGCDYTPPADWTVIKGRYGNPNPARNAGWNLAADRGAQWIVFWDADNLMGEGYLFHASRRIKDVPNQVGILSPDVVREGPQGMRWHVRQPGARTYWSGRERSLSDTSSLWRVEALCQTGGFNVDNTMLDDYTQALRVTALGWRVESLNMPVLLTDHNANRSSEAARGESDLWNNRTFHIVTLLAGRDTVLRAWSRSAHGMNLPPHTHLTLVDDSGCALFGRDVRAEAESLSLRPEIQSVRILKAPPKTAPPTTWLAIHRRVAMLYNLALSGQTHDMTLMWEDDVIPVNNNALRLLHEGFLPFTRLAGVGAVYACRSNPLVAVASGDATRWAAMPLMTALDKWATTQNRRRFGMIGGGFTLWAGHFLARALPLQASPEAKLGWDGCLGRELHQQGCTLELDLRVHADHLVNA